MNYSTSKLIEKLSMNSFCGTQTNWSCSVYVVWSFWRNNDQLLLHLMACKYSQQYCVSCRTNFSPEHRSTNIAKIVEQNLNHHIMVSPTNFIIAFECVRRTIYHVGVVSWMRNTSNVWLEICVKHELTIAVGCNSTFRYAMSLDFITLS